ncbi:MAG: glycosyltransferase, partial [Bacteroidales bacterium]|nr:glycosyltransferase [Bacteroidales bacterium]
VYVGVLSESKGILYILQSLRKVREKGYKVTLYIAGGYSSSVKSFIEKNFKDLSLEILGRISFEELQHYYKESDIGIIASLQEQCSYVAIEMAMFGLPIVTTAVDGLDEMFTDGVNALKVNTRFSKVFGLSVDTDSLAEKIITLIENGELRQRLSANVRQLYKERFNLETMMQQTLAVYRKLSGHFEEVQQTKKKSLLFCIDSLNSGGAEKLLLNIIECMDYDRCDIDLLIIHEHGVYFKDIPEQVNWFTLKEADSYLFKKYDVEIAFQEGYSTKHIAHRNSGALKIAWVHCDFSSFHWTTGFYKDNAEEQWCYSQLDKIVFVSGQTLKSFNHLFPDIQTVKQVIHNPINREEILAASQSAIIQKDKLTLCCMGRLIECKGYLRLIPILSKLKKDGLDFECWIIGEGKQKQEIDELIQQHSLEQTVLMKGFYSNPYPYLAASDLFVSASFTEGYSLAICEALCLGKPMLVTEVSGAKEIVGDCGLIVPQDEQSIYEGLRKLIEDKNLREGLSKKAFSRSKSIFDYRKNMQEILELLKNEMSYE